jgi:Ca2+-binding RTX toxin-like protein
MAVYTSDSDAFGLDNSADTSLNSDPPTYLLRSIDGSTVVSHTATHVQLSNTMLSDQWDLYGNFTAFNDAGQPTAGTVTDFGAGGGKQLTGLDVNVTEFFAAPTTANILQLFTDAFSGADSITTSSGAVDNYILGYAGNDTIDSHASPLNDTLFGGDGADVIFGGTGFNRVNGNAGDDTVIGHSTTGDWLLGGQGDDSITAIHSTAHNIINGNLGDDTVMGGDGGDSLRGGQGDDLLIGGSGADWITGDLGTNSLVGGAGANTFHAGAGHDTVTDFGLGQGDRVQIDSSLTYTVSQSGSDVHIDLSNGGEMVLANTQETALGPTSGWIISS